MAWHGMASYVRHRVAPNDLIYTGKNGAIAIAATEPSSLARGTDS